MIVAGERRNQLAAAAARLKLPAVITARHPIAVEPADTERDAPMRATVAHGKHAPIVPPPEDQRQIEQHGRCQLALFQRVGSERRVPVVVDQRCGRPLNRNPSLGRRLQVHFDPTIPPRPLPRDPATQQRSAPLAQRYNTGTARLSPRRCPNGVTMPSVSLAFGIACIFVVLFDAFQTIILPRRATGRFRLTRLFYIATWRPWSFVVRRVCTVRRRETAFSFYGPLSLIFLLALWAGGLVVGFALIFHALGSPFNDTMKTTPCSPIFTSAAQRCSRLALAM